MIIFVGDKPGRKNVSPDVPFVGTQSYKRLLEWIWRMDIDITDVKTANTTDFARRVGVNNLLTSPKIIALGKSAKKHLDNLKLEYRMEGGLYPIPGRPYKPTQIALRHIPLDVFELPHPSGLNRKLNDEEWLNQQLQECKKWLKKI